MTDESPAALLGEVEKLRRLTRARVHGAALPLAVFGLLTLASAVLYKTPFVRVFRGGDDINHLSNGPICLEGCDSVHSIGYDVSGYAGLYWSDRSAALSIAFWLIVAPLCYAGCAWWYRRRAERTGLMMRWQSWAYVGVARWPSSS
jgi:hypothetical protein